jgi:hypothetical protein
MSRNRPRHPGMRASTALLGHHRNFRQATNFHHVQEVGPSSALSRSSWCRNLVGHAGWSQGAKISYVERIDAIASCLLRTPQVHSVVNAATRPTIDCAVVHYLPILFRRESHQFHVRQNHLFEDLPRFTWIKWRLERGPRQHRVNFCQAMTAEIPVILPAD